MSGTKENLVPQSPEEQEIPTDYALTEGEKRHGAFLPEYNLWITLRGGNGRWQQARAREDWFNLCIDYEEKERQRKEEELRLRFRRGELAKLRRQEEEELRRRVEESEIEKRRRKEEEARLVLQREEEARQRRLEEERQSLLRKPRACHYCTGTGKCATCGGDGRVDALFLSSSVGLKKSPVPQGRMSRGCKSCDGSGDSGSSDFFPGSGKCGRCCGCGNINAPPGGWPSHEPARKP